MRSFGVVVIAAVGMISCAGRAGPSNAARVVAGLRPAFRACYNAGLARDARLSGRIDLAITVQADGSVSVVTGQRLGYLDDATTSCVIDTARGARFEPPKGGLAVVKFPVWFVPTPPGGSR